MSKAPLLAAAVLAFAAFAVPAQATSTSAPVDCFRNTDVNSFTPIDDNTLRVRISSTRQYDLHSAQGHVRDLRANLRIALTSHTRRICTGPGVADLEIVQLRPIRQTWSVDQVTRVPVEALATPHH